MYYWIVWLLLVLCCLICIPSVTDTDVSGGAVCYNCIKCYSGPVTLGFQRRKTNNYFSFMWKYAVGKCVWLLDLESSHRKRLLKTSRMEFRENTSLLHGEHPTLFFFFLLACPTKLTELLNLEWRAFPQNDVNRERQQLHTHWRCIWWRHHGKP